MKKFTIFLTLLCAVAFAQQGTFTDSRDGKKYRTVKIGEQTWMAENLNYNASGSKCYENNSSNCNNYGRLYDWKTAMKACPSGWHLPSGEEWCSLIDLVGDSVAGWHLKAESGWTDCRRGKNGIDTYGFAALPSGEGYQDGRFSNFGYNSRWWSSAEYEVYAYSPSMNCGSDSYGMLDLEKSSWLNSVRCLKNDNKKISKEIETPSCAVQNRFRQKPDIIIDEKAIFMKKKEIAKTDSVAEQNSLQIESLVEELKSSSVKNKSATKIQVAPNIRYKVLFKIISTLGASNRNDIVLTTSIKGKDEYDNTIWGISPLKVVSSPNGNNLNLSLFISKDYFEIHARGGSLPRIYFKENLDAVSKHTYLQALHKENEEDSGTVLMSVYSKSDSAYVNVNNKFIANMSEASLGSIVATLAESSSRRLACGRTAPGLEDICEKGKVAISLKPRNAYDELAKTLIMLHNRFIDSPDADYITIFADDDITFDKVFRAMDRARNAGFFKSNFAKSLDGNDIIDINSNQILMSGRSLAESDGRTEGGSSDMLGSLMGGSGGTIGTKTKGSLKAPSASDIDLGDGSRSKAEIMQVVNARMSGLRNIYNKYLKRYPGFSGKVTLKFTIAPGGNITNISVVSSTTNHSDFDDEVKTQVSRWKWKATKSVDTTPTVPFNFEE